MKTKYIKLALLAYVLFTILSLIMLSMALYCMIFISSFSISIALFYFFMSLTILFMTFGGLEVKLIEIKKKNIVFKQIFGIIYYKYSFTEIIGFKVNTLHKKNNKEYLQLLIRTTYDKVIEINGILISNISEIEKELKKVVRYDNSIKEPIINLKVKAIILTLICSLICFLWLLISIF